ncbi:MAG TPA: hypothetical protein VH143_01760 [Kofleriaceae bacterium]|nr:hypothetical protein [Kofleriaceae bacterium]
MQSWRPTETHRGSPLVEAVLTRMLELDAVLEHIDDKTTIEAIAIATELAAAGNLVTGDIRRTSDAVAVALARWLERTRHLGVNVDPVPHAA